MHTTILVRAYSAIQKNCYAQHLFHTECWSCIKISAAVRTIATVAAAVNLGSTSYKSYVKYSKFIDNMKWIN